jgi:hypothetical protein
MKTTCELLAFGAVLVVLGAGLVWYMAANPAPRTAPPAPGAAATTTPKTTHLEGAYYTIDAAYPASTPLAPSADAAAVATISGFIATTSAQFIAENNLDTMTAADAAAQGLGPDEKYSLAITYDTYSSPNTLSYVFTIFEDTLGAHPNTQYQSFTFDPSTGSTLALADLFTPGSQYLDKLSALTRASLSASLGSDIDPTEFINPGTTPDAASFSIFALDGSDLVIFFPPYAVAPYSSGPQQVRIPLSQLSDVLKPEYK